MASRVVKYGLGALILAAGGWSAWWYAGATGQEQGLAYWLDKQRTRGWQAEAAEIEVTGYPTDFRLTAREIQLADPRTGWAWRAPEWRAESTAWAPTRVAVTWAPEQVLATETERVDIRAGRWGTLIDLRPGPAMELREATTDIADLVLAARSGWTAGAELVDLQLAERPEDLAPPNSYDLSAVAMTVELPKELVAALDPTGWLEPSVDRLTVKGHAALDAPLDRATLEDGRLAVRAATIREAGFDWGDMRLVLKGTFEVDDDGYPVGEIEVEAREWRQMVRLAQSSGVIDRDTARTVIKGVEFFTALSGSGDSLVAPFGLSGGKVRLGPFAIADAPRLAPAR